MLDAAALLHPYRSQLATIRQLVGVPCAHWEAFYSSVFEAYAGFVQQLPASEAHHHAGPGGMLAHGLKPASMSTFSRVISSCTMREATWPPGRTSGPTP